MEHTHKCDDCGWTGPIGDTAPIRDIEQRVCPGEYFPAGECPECGSLVPCTEQDIRESGNVPNARELVAALTRAEHHLRHGGTVDQLIEAADSARAALAKVQR